jgi:hypothetical protein
MLQLKQFSLGIACLITLSASTTECANQSCGARAWAMTQAIGKVGWSSTKGIIIGSGIGALVGGGSALVGFCSYQAGQIHCDGMGAMLTVAGTIAGGLDGVLIGGLVGCVRGMRHLRKAT